MIQNTIRRMPRQSEAAELSTNELRDTFLVSGLYEPGEAHGLFTDLDRLVVGGIVPSREPVELPNHRETGRAFFLEQRELGAINTGGPGLAQIDGKTMAVDSLACLYVGVGSKKVTFASRDPDNLAKFFFLSCPAHAAHPSAVMTRGEATAVTLGSQAGANLRTIRKFIHTGGIRSCQLVMGYTELAEGNVWNSFPPHTHYRRTEIYFYFDLGERVLVHFLGEPASTRHLFLHNE